MKTRIIHAVAGTFIMASLLLGIYVNPKWFWFTGFVGANLFQSAFTNWCLMANILEKMGIRDEKENCCN